MNKENWTRNYDWENELRQQGENRDGYLTNTGDVVLLLEYSTGKTRENYVDLCKTWKIFKRGKKDNDVFFIKREYDQYPIFISEEFATKIMENPETIVKYAIIPEKTIECREDIDRMYLAERKKRKDEIVEIMQLDHRLEKDEFCLVKAKQMLDENESLIWQYFVNTGKNEFPIAITNGLAEKTKADPQNVYRKMCSIYMDRYR